MTEHTYAVFVSDYPEHKEDDIRFTILEVYGDQITYLHPPQDDLIAVELLTELHRETVVMLLTEALAKHLGENFEVSLESEEDW